MPLRHHPVRDTTTARIEPVHDHPSLHDTIAGWLWNEWGTPANRELYKSLVAHSRKDAVPAIWVAFDTTIPVGTVGLLRTDLVSRQEFTPWMAVLYVIPEYRGRGIAAQLQEHVLDEARRLGYDEIFLYTKMTGFYERTGWEYVESDVDDHGSTVRIYRKAL